MIYNKKDIPEELHKFFVRAEIGLEETPAQFVAKLVEVFREVRRVLKDDGTLWLNLGDSYAANRGTQPAPTNTRNKDGHAAGQRVSDGLKPKDLIGIPWRVAFALQQPYYAGKVADERDRVWLAAMVDAEGSICGTEYQTGDRTKTNIYISITNTSVPIIEKCERLFPQDVKHVYEKSGPSSRMCYRWDVERMETKALFLREIYPHLVAKRKQAIVGYTFLEMQKGLLSKKKGYLPEQHEQRSWLMATLSKLNAGEDVDLPDWMIEPPSLHEPGFYLRQDIIWSKPNPMPESVQDRCTKAHEYMFLLSKSPSYYYDIDAVREPFADASVERLRQDIANQKGSTRVPGKTNGPKKAVGLNDNRSSYRAGSASNMNDGARVAKSDAGLPLNEAGRNKRSVWTVATTSYSGAHFATFPTALIEPCILAGAPAGGVVLDPFFGSGTTGQVAQNLGRAFIGCELNPAYESLQAERLRQMGLILEAA